MSKNLYWFKHIFLKYKHSVSNEFFVIQYFEISLFIIYSYPLKDPYKPIFSIICHSKRWCLQKWIKRQMKKEKENYLCVTCNKKFANVSMIKRAPLNTRKNGIYFDSMKLYLYITDYQWRVGRKNCTDINGHWRSRF